MASRATLPRWGSLVYDAYCFYGNDSNISIAFVTNNARTTIVADYKLNHCLEQGDMGDALAIAENELQATEHSLDKLQGMIALNLGPPWPRARRRRRTG